MHPRPADPTRATSRDPGPAPAIRRLAERSPALALLLFSLLVAAVSTAWLVVQSPNFFTGYDFMRMHFFYKTYYREALLSGRLPLWNPYVGLGRPFMADAETATLYPPNLLVLALGVYGGVAASVLLHQAVAVYGGVRLGQTMGATTGASLLLGAGAALASPFTARLDVGIVEGYFSLCWLPVVLWLGARLQDRRSAGTAAGFAVAVALMILAGQPPLAFVEFLGLLIFLVLRQRWPSGRADIRPCLGNALGVAGAGLVGVGLACAQLLPFLELVGQGNRPLEARDFAVANGMPAPSWLSLIIPTSGNYAPNWEYGVHCGLVPLFAALGGLLLWRDRNVRALLGLGLVGALLAAGDRAPFLRWATHVLPGAAALRIPSRYGILFAFALLGTGAVALSREASRGALVLLLMGLVAASAWVVWLEPYVVRGGPGAGAYYGVHLGAVGASALLVALWHLRGRWPRRAALIGCLLGLFCAANWLWAIHLQAPVYSPYGFAVEDADLGAAARARGLLVPGGAPPRVSFSSRYVRENSGMAQGYASFDSYVAPSLYRTWDYVHAATGVPVSKADFIRLPEAVSDHAQLLDSLNLVADYDPALRSLALRAHPDPRAYVAYDREVVADWRTAVQRMAERRDFHARALVEEGAAPDFAPAPGAHAGGAAVTGFEPERVTVRATADAPAILVLAEAWYPGWRAEVNGSLAAVFPVNGWMRGVVIPPGTSEVTFTFHSRLLALGAAMSLVSAALLAALVARRAPQ